MKCYESQKTESVSHTVLTDYSDTHENYVTKAQCHLHKLKTHEIIEPLMTLGKIT